MTRTTSDTWVNRKKTKRVKKRHSAVYSQEKSIQRTSNERESVYQVFIFKDTEVQALAGITSVRQKGVCGLMSINSEIQEAPSVPEEREAALVSGRRAPICISPRSFCPPPRRSLRATLKM